MAEEFLVDSGADRIVFRAHFLRTLHLAVSTDSNGSILQGIGGVSESVVVQTVVILL